MNYSQNTSGHQRWWLGVFLYWTALFEQDKLNVANFKFAIYTMIVVEI